MNKLSYLISRWQKRILRLKIQWCYGIIFLKNMIEKYLCHNMFPKKITWTQIFSKRFKIFIYLLSHLLQYKKDYKMHVLSIFHYLSRNMEFGFVARGVEYRVDGLSSPNILVDVCTLHPSFARSWKY